MEIERTEPDESRKDLPSLIIRLKAIFLDTFVLVGIMALFTYAFEAIEYEGEVIRKYAYLSLLFYDPVMVSLGGTIGHRLMKIRVRSFTDESKNLQLHLALVRFIVKTFLGWLSLLTINANESKRAIHDLVSNSIVLELSHQD